MMKKLGILAFVAAVALSLALAYRLARNNVAGDVYRQRLQQLRDDHNKVLAQYADLHAGYNALRNDYNDAVKRTAVTELVVYEDSSVCVAFIAADGTEKIVPTPFKMGSEVYVDFIIIDGKNFFRRVFDENTAPNQAMVIDPANKDISLEKGRPVRGKATYARLDTPGRWTVTLSGNGALDIAKKADDAPTTVLMPPPPVKEYPQVDKKYPDVQQQVNEQIDDITPGDVLRSLFGSAQS